MTTVGRDVTIFVPSLYGGGAERVMIDLANGLARRGHRVDLVVSTTAQSNGRYLRHVSDDVCLVDLASPRLRFVLARLTRYVSKNKKRFYISALTEANMLLIASCVLAGARPSLALTEHNVPSRALATGRAAKVLRWLIPFVYARATHVIGVSQGVVDELNAVLFDPRARLIYNPIDVKEIAAASKLPSDDDSIEGRIILAVGRLEPQKNFGLLLRSFALLPADQGLTLVILGEGHEAAKLKAEALSLGIAERVRFPGFVGNPFAWMRRSSVVVLSSDYEGFGNVLVEALACGTRVVSTDCPSGPSEILEQGKWGRLVPVGDASALAGAINAALLDGADTAGVVRAKDFDVDRAVDQYEALIRGASPTF